MTKIQLAYLAGLFDGEGYFLIENNQGSQRPLVGIDMTCEKTIRLVHSLAAVGAVRVKNTNPKHKPQWKWRTSYSGARYFAALLYPYLVTKKDEAKKIIDHVKLRQGRKPTLPPAC